MQLLPDELQRFLAEQAERDRLFQETAEHLLERISFVSRNIQNRVREVLGQSSFCRPPCPQDDSPVR